MAMLKNETDFLSELSEIDQKIDRLNDQKIVAFFEALELTSREDIPKNYLSWKTILVVVPSRQVSNELKKFKFSINRIAFATNTNARQIHLYDLQDWKKAFSNKTQLQIRGLLKNSFGGVAKSGEAFIKETIARK